MNIFVQNIVEKILYMVNKINRFHSVYKDILKFSVSN